MTKSDKDLVGCFKRKYSFTSTEVCRKTGYGEGGIISQNQQIEMTWAPVKNGRYDETF